MRSLHSRGPSSPSKTTSIEKSAPHSPPQLIEQSPTRRRPFHSFFFVEFDGIGRVFLCVAEVTQMVPSCLYVLQSESALVPYVAMLCTLWRI